MLTKCNVLIQSLFISSHDTTGFKNHIVRRKVSSLQLRLMTFEINEISKMDTFPILVENSLVFVSKVEHSHCDT